MPRTRPVPVDPMYALAVGARLADDAAAAVGTAREAEHLRAVADTLRDELASAKNRRADYDARHGARADGFPPSDSDPATGAQYGEAV